MTLFDHFESVEDKADSFSKFQFDKVQFEFPSTLISFKVSNNILVLGFKSLVLWIDLERPNSINEFKIQDLEEIFLSKVGNQMICSSSSGTVFYFKTGAQNPNSFSSTVNTNAAGNSPGLQIFTKIQGRISAVGWPKTLNGPILVATRGKIYVTPKVSKPFKLIGKIYLNAGGAVYELELLNQQKLKEKTCRIVYNAGGLVSGIEYWNSTDGIRVLLTTGDRVVQFKGTPGVPLGILMQEPIDIQEMTTTLPTKFSLQSSTFSWLTAPGIYTGKLDTSNPESLLTDIILIPYPILKNQEIQALGLEQTSYHYIILVKNGCVIMNKVDTSITNFIKLPLEDDETIIGLQTDALKQTYWISTSKSLYEIIVWNEDEDIWKIYFERGMYKEALGVVKEGNRSKVAERYADQVLENGDYDLAAGIVVFYYR